MRTKLRSKVTLLFMTFGLVLAIPAVALADNIQNDVAVSIDPNDAGAKVLSVQAGQKSAQVGYRITATGGDTGDTTGSTGERCNLVHSGSETVTISGLPSGATAAKSVTVENLSGNTLSAPHLTFTQCGVDQFVKFNVGSEVAAGNYTISVADISNLSPDPGANNIDGYNESPATFTLRVTAPADTAKPTGVSISIDDAAAWTKDPSANVTLDLSATDNAGVTKYRLAETQAGLATATDVAVSPAQANFSALNVPFTLSGTEALAKPVWLRVFDAQGNFEDASDTIGWDKTAPTIDDLGPTTPANLAGWYKANVTNEFQASDALSGLNAACVTAFPANQAVPAENVQSKTTSTEGTGITVTSDSCTDVAGNTSTGVQSDGFNIDKTAPAVLFDANASAFNDNPSFDFGSVPGAPTCSATDTGGSGVTAAGCAVTGYSNAVGNHTLTGTAADIAGNEGTANLSYDVVAWRLSGFYQPVDMGGVTNYAKAGSTVPLKFEIFQKLSNTELTNTSAVNTFTQKVACGTFSPAMDDIENYATGGTSLRYDTTGGQFIFNWQTPKSAGTCFTVTMSPSDGSGNSIVAYFKLR